MCVAFCEARLSLGNISSTSNFQAWQSESPGELCFVFKVILLCSGLGTTASPLFSKPCPLGCTREHLGQGQGPGPVGQGLWPGGLPTTGAGGRTRPPWGVRSLDSGFVFVDGHANGLPQKSYGAPLCTSTQNFSSCNNYQIPWVYRESR